MDHIISARHSKTQLKGDMLNMLGEEIYYRLYLLRCPSGRSYAINITSGKESATCLFGKDREEAIGIYEKIVRNTVTPCSLREIADDFNKVK